MKPLAKGRVPLRLAGIEHVMPKDEHEYRRGWDIVLGVAEGEQEPSADSGTDDDTQSDNHND